MDIPDELSKFIKKVKSIDETYYLVYKKVNNIKNAINFKNYTIYDDMDNSTILNQSSN